MRAREGVVRAGRLFAVGVSALVLCACSIMPRFRSDPPPPPPMPTIAEMPKGEAGGVFSPAMPWVLVSDNRAFRPGDALTVVLQETTQASKSADTSYGKENNVAISPTTVAGKTIKSDVGISAQRDFTGKSQSTQQNALEGSITVLVQNVLPNGLLLVSGEKSLRLNQGEEFIRVAGYVRSADIDTENRVSSQRIANASITYSGRGVLAETNSPGWLAKFFASNWMPF